VAETAQPGTTSAEATAAAPGAPTTGGGSTLTAPAANAATAGTPGVTAPALREVVVPTGTRLPLELLTAVSSETSRVEDPVRARLTRDVQVDGVVVVPAGTVLRGNVTDVERAGRVRGRSRIAFRFTDAEVRGAEERLRTAPLVFLGEASTKEDAAKIGGGAVAGAVIGGRLGGSKGAAQGAVVGGGAGTGVVLATRGDEVSRAAGATMTATLSEAATLQVPR
jgi:hypothetical protein